MARKRIVSRTIKYCEVEVKMVDLENEKVVTGIIRIPGHKKSDKQIQSLFKKYDFTGCYGENHKIVSIVSYKNKEEKRFMSEEKFLAQSEIYSPNCDSTEEDEEIEDGSDEDDFDEADEFNNEYIG